MKRKTIIALITAAVMTAFCGLTAFADGDVAGAVESTWNSAQSQIKTIVNNVVFPVIDVILAILLFAKAIAFFVKLALTYFEYRKHGQFEWAAPAILFGCLLF